MYLIYIFRLSLSIEPWLMVILQAETSHQTDTVLEQIEEIYKRTGEAGSFRPSVEKALLGAIVTTR